jgi:hypothetical protein
MLLGFRGGEAAACFTKAANISARLSDDEICLNLVVSITGRHLRRAPRHTYRLDGNAAIRHNIPKPEVEAPDAYSGGDGQQVDYGR